MNKRKLNVFDKNRYVKNVCLAATLAVGLVGSGMMPQISKGDAGYKLAISNVAMAASSNVQWISGNGLPISNPLDRDDNIDTNLTQNNALWHWSQSLSMVNGSFLFNGGSYIMLRGYRSNNTKLYCASQSDHYISLGYLTNSGYVSGGATIGWRPVLEVSDTDPLIYGHKDGDVVKFGTLYVNNTKRKITDIITYNPYNSFGKGDYEIRDTDSDDAYKVQWVLATSPKTGKKILIADRNLVDSICKSDLTRQQLDSGKSITIDGMSYTIRILDGGTYDSSKRTMTDNEWDAIIGIGEGSWQVDNIYNIDDATKYGSWFKGFYGKATNANNQFMNFNLSGNDGTSTMHSGGIIQNQSSIKGKYFLDNGQMVLIDNYGMVQYYKDFNTTNPDTLAVDGDAIDHVGTLIFGNGTIKTVLYMKDGSLKYVDTDESIHDMTLKQNDIKDMFAYKYANGQSQKMLLQKSDGSLVYLDDSGNVKTFGINMNNVAYIMDATNVNKDLFVMKDGTLRDDTGIILPPSGVTINKIWSNRIFEMSDGFLYTLQNGTFKKTTTLAKIVDKAKNQAVLLKNGNFQTVDNNGSLNNLTAVNGSNVKSFVQLDANNQYILMNDGTTYGIGPDVQGDKLESHGIDITHAKAVISNGASNVSKLIVMDTGDVYVNEHNGWIGWVKSTYVKLNSDVVTKAENDNGIYTDVSKIPTSQLISKGPAGDSAVDKVISDATKPADTTAPAISVSGNPISWQNTDATINITAADETGGSGVASITLPDGTVVNGNTASFKATQNGTYTIKAADKAGNVATQVVTVSKIDKVAPTLPTIANNNGTITITPGTDSESGTKEVDYSVDGSSYQKYISQITLGAGKHTVKAKSVDNAGNESTEVSQDITVKDKALEDASNAVDKAENSKNQDDLDNAKKIVDALPSGDDKTKLENEISDIQKEIDSQKAIKDATDAVNIAKNTLNQSDLDTAKGLVDKLPDGSDKDNLKNEIKNIQDSIDKINANNQALDEATAAVTTAEKTKFKADYDAARDKVNELEDRADKKSLQSRLDTVKSYVDKLIADAGTKVTKAENTKTDDDINLAQEAISNVPEGWDVSDLQNRLNNVKKNAEDQLLINAKTAVEKAESTLEQEDVNSARNLVNNLPSGQDKTSLSGRIAAVEKLINEFNTAESRVDSAEKLETQSSVTSAMQVVNTLPDGSKKDSLNKRLDVVENEIELNNDIKGIDEEITALDRDISYRMNYNAAIDIDAYENKIKDLKGKIDDLPDSVSDTKGNFNKRIDTIEDKLAQKKAVQEAIDKVIDALNKASQSLSYEDIQAAQEAIDNLPQGIDKAKYNIELRGIKQKVQGVAAAEINEANAAVTKVSRTKLKSDFDLAASLVESLPQSSAKTNLEKVLSIISKYVK
ncbi:OmpL47-type beta-barrel domain-containing protein [Clostridium sp. HV4-5-A1G]|uniref:OmpL47-type beta-barrel domain-containing protein n=1 Tax=Clostridium sp. HV4-5-A1G TaxID=2004595 RepID=UPI00123A6908|nr:hypothetical protein [Clostridium sp. HV4-5-A1G]KAA8666600.1 hypothetical protein F3O63_16740 [Clostridium sp. HV4-5-A1G]